MEDKYIDCFTHGRPVHSGDAFSRKHPAMSLQRRAKLFMPFDALDGYSDAIAERQKVTQPPPELTEDEKAELDRRFTVLSDLYRSGTHVLVTILFFQEDLRASGRGTFRETCGMLTRIDPVGRYLQVVEIKIAFDNIYRLTSDALPSDA